MTTPARVLSVAKHEAGHNVVARCLGFGVGDCNVTVHANGHQGDSGIRPATPLVTLGEIKDYLRKRVKVLYAGALAESLVGGKVDEDAAVICIRHLGGKDDHSKARELIHLLRNIEHPKTVQDEERQKQLDSLDSELWNGAAEIVEKEAAVIGEVATHIARRFKKVGVPFNASKDSIDALPAVQKRFGAL